VSLNLFRQLCVYLAPILPRFADEAGRLLNAPISAWTDAQTPVTGRAIAPYENLMARVDPARVLAMVEASRESAPAPAAPAAPALAAAPAPAAEPLAATIAFDDFAKVDLRVAEVLTAEEVPKAKKIVKLRVSLGQLGERTIFAGIKAAFPEVAVLVGRRIVVVANLAPRTMSFGVSEGMVIAAGEGAAAYLLTPDPGAEPGMRLH
jgi:methionyl-tRNA synthetase